MRMTTPRPTRTFRWGRLRAELWRDRHIYLMIIPVFILLLVIKYWPMWFLRISFYDYKLLKGFDGSAFVGLKWYGRLFANANFGMMVRNTLAINLLSLAFVFPAPIFFALLLNEVRMRRFKRVVQTISYLPHFISMVVLTAMIITFLSPSVGTLAGVMKSLGRQPVYYLGEADYFRTIMILSAIWQGVGWNAIVYLSALTSIDQALYEAAIIDGATRTRRIWHVTLPGISPTIIILLILQIGNLMNVNFEKIYLLQNNMNLEVSEVLQTFVYKTGMVQTNYSYATAAGLFNSVISLVLVLLSNRVSRAVSETSLF